MRSVNGVPPRVALTPAALTFLNLPIGGGRPTPSMSVEPRACAPRDFEMREFVNQHFSLEPSGFPILRVTL